MANFINITNITENANNILEITREINNISGNLYVIFLLISLWIITFSVFANLDKKVSIMVASVVTSFVSILLWMASLVGMFTLTPILVLTAISIIVYSFNK